MKNQKARRLRLHAFRAKVMLESARLVGQHSEDYLGADALISAVQEEMDELLRLLGHGRMELEPEAAEGEGTEAEEEEEEQEERPVPLK